MSTATQAIAEQLFRARQQHRRVVLPSRARPSSADDAYAVQEAVGRLLGSSAIGWKVGAPDARTTPNAAPIYDILQSPARIAANRLHMIGVEAEVAAVFGRDLPAREAPYGEAEVMEAVEELLVAIEVCDSRLADWESADDHTKLADHQLNYALVVGEGTRAFMSIDYARLQVRTMLDGKLLKEGTGTHAVGNPLVLLPWLANHARTRGGIAKGAIATTGAWLGMHTVAPGTDVVVEFPAIGSARVSFPA
jgi:2-keto-4-pentenoate hydratase